MIATENRRGRHSLTVRLMPSTATEPLETNKRPEIVGDLKSKDGKLALLFDRRDGADAVDVAGDQMAAEALLQAHRLLEIDQAAGLERVQVGACQRFWRHIDGESVLESS